MPLGWGATIDAEDTRQGLLLELGSWVGHMALTLPFLWSLFPSLWKQALATSTSQGAGSFAFENTASALH